MPLSRFAEYCRRKEAAAMNAAVAGFTTVFADVAGLDAIGNAWTEQLFDGCFYSSASARASAMPLVNVIFVQSQDGNTVADDPSTLGGGETDKHLVYEGLSRVHVDAVLAGAATVRDGEIVFSVWHPQLVALRQQCGRRRHPIQIVVTDSG